MLKKGVCCLIIISGLYGLCGVGLSQEINDSSNISGNIESYTNKLSIYTFGISRFNNFELSANGDKHSIHYGPNESLNLGFGFNYKWLGMGLSLNTDYFSSDEDLYGETRSLDIQMDIFKKTILYTANLQYYEGYYWQNPDDFLHNWNTHDSLRIRPDIKTLTFGVNGIYVFNNDRFSFKAAYQNTERQIKSAGSWLAAGKVSLYSISADSSLVPYEISELYPNVKDIKGLTAINIGGAVGYTYTYIFGDYFYLNGALLLGLNFQGVSRVSLSDENIGGPVKLSSNAQIKLAIGCNKPHVFYGFSASIDSYNINSTDDSEFTYSYGKIRFYYGRRFNISKK